VASNSSGEVRAYDLESLAVEHELEAPAKPIAVVGCFSGDTGELIATGAWRSGPCLPLSTTAARSQRSAEPTMISRCVACRARQTPGREATT
jgi:hypothetical protein